MMVGQLLRLSSWYWSSWHLSGIVPCEKLERVESQHVKLILDEPEVDLPECHDYSK